MPPPPHGFPTCRWGIWRIFYSYISERAQVSSLSNFSRGLRATTSPSCCAAIAQCVGSLAIHLHSPLVSRSNNGACNNCWVFAGKKTKLVKWKWSTAAQQLNPEQPKLASHPKVNTGNRVRRCCLTVASPPGSPADRLSQCQIFSCSSAYF